MMLNNKARIVKSCALDLSGKLNKNILKTQGGNYCRDIIRSPNHSVLFSCSQEGYIYTPFLPLLVSMWLSSGYSKVSESRKVYTWYQTACVIFCSVFPCPFVWKWRTMRMVEQQQQENIDLKGFPHCPCISIRLCHERRLDLWVTTWSRASRESKITRNVCTGDSVCMLEIHLFVLSLWDFGTTLVSEISLFGLNPVIP